MDPPASAYLPRYPLREQRVLSSNSTGQITALPPLETGSSAKSGGPSAGMIVGISVAVVVALLMCTGVAFFALEKRKRKRKSAFAAAPSKVCLRGACWPLCQHKHMFP